MRNFYIFEIKEEVEKITKKNPYELFHTLETIYYRTPEEAEMSYHFIKQLIKPIPIKELDISLFKRYKESYFYTKYRNVHRMFDVYRRESTTLTLCKTYLKLETNVVKPRFLEELQRYNFFVCDFEGKDYFWLDSLEKMVIG